MNARKLVFIILFVAVSSVSAFSAWTEPVPVTIVNDSSAEEWSPFLSFDGLTLYFARAISPTSYYGKIYAAIRDEPFGPFTSVQKLDDPLNNAPGHNLCPWVSCDNLRMYYHNETSGRYRIMLSERVSVNDPWPSGVSIEELNSLGDKLQAPSLTQDELIMVFDAYEISGGKGSYDIWMATRPDKNSSFTQYRNLSEINSEFDENRTSVSPDGLELYFDSNRNGQPQIFKATRSSLDDPFGNPVLLSEFDVPGTINSHPFFNYSCGEFYFRRELASDRSTRDIYVSYYSDNAYYVDSNNGDDLNTGTSSQTAFATIQKAVDTAPDGYKILVNPGIYTEPIDFHGKAITVQGQAGPDGIPILEAPDNFAVTFAGGEGPNSILKNIVIKNSFMAVFIVGSSPTISNVTIVDNIYGISAYVGSNPDISSCIFRNNLYGDLSGCISRYSLTTEAGEGNICNEPLFADPNNNDYHLKSERGRYWPDYDVWVLDKVSSLCIDTGDPRGEPSAEPMPNGGFINMGAYGGTAYASMSEMPFPEPDFNHDGIVDESDLSELVEQWLAVSGWFE